MQEQKKIVVGLDIGTTKVCAVVGCQNDYGNIDILGIGKAVSEGVKEGAISNVNMTVDAILKAVSQASEDSSVNIFAVNVGIAGKNIRCEIHRGSIIRESNENEIQAEDVSRLTSSMYNLVTEPGWQIIHVLPQVYTIDYQETTKYPVGMSGARLEADFNVIFSSANNVHNIKKCVERAGLEVENLILQPLASSLAVLSEQEKEAGVCLVDIGGGTTDVAIFEDKILRHTAVLPFGGNIITSDIKQGCGVLLDQAEKMKVRFGKALSSQASENEVVSIPSAFNRPPKEISIRNLAAIIEARMEEIASFILKEIEIAGYRDKLAAGIVLTGGGSMLKNLAELFEYKTGIDTRIGYPNIYLGKCKHDEVKNPQYATAVGLVLSSFRSLDDRERTLEEAKFLSQPYERISRQDKSLKKEIKRETEQQIPSIFSSIVKKAKELLIDDFDDKMR
ncbi:MAG: cell division protein FtsA [Cytophagales bacterium]|nr:cell division protein FtsA [Cytophagales bacterium]MDW8384431.1 cell division protein FtsA [Flammeovirgaceae bacterium]